MLCYSFISHVRCRFNFLTGLCQLKRPPTFGGVSKEGHLTLVLPQPSRRLAHRRPSDATIVRLDYSSRWTLNSALTTQHMLALVATADANASCDALAFNNDYWKIRRFLRYFGFNVIRVLLSK